MINITKYTKPKKSSTSTIVSSGGGVITNNSSLTVDTALSPTSTNAVENKAIYKALMDMINQIVNTDNTLDISRSGDTVTINSNTFKFDTNGHLKYNGDVDVSTISATSGTINTINSNYGRIQEITGNVLDYENGEIYDLTGDNLNYKDATLETLTVTKAAHFFELIIDQIKSTQGQIIITPANAKFDWVDSTPTNYYRCYWKNEDDEKQIGNKFEVNDQVVCQTFNVTTGTSYNASNKYYWALVVNTGSYELDGEHYHYIDISKTDKDNNSNGVPEAGDEVAQLGNRNLTDRQAAIIISAYNNQFLDSAIQAPSIVQYAGINNYDLSTHRTNVISKGFNQFKGKFSTNSGSDIEQMIADIGEGTTMYIHTAYANSSDGQTNFSKTYFNGAEYIGMCSNFSSTDTDLVYSNYTWMRLKGETGDAGFSYNLLPTREYATVSSSDVLSMGFTYQLVKVEGTTVTTVNPAQSNFYMRFKSDIAPYTQLNRGTTSFSFSSSSYYTNYHKTTPRPTYFTVELLENQTIVETRVVNIRFAAGAELTIADEINASVQSVEGDLNTYKQTANASISSLTNRMGTAESNITQTQTSIQTEVTARINGDRKYFPIQKPFYTYNGEIVTDYINDPIRYNGGLDIYSTPVSVAAGKYILRFYCTIGSVSTLESWFQLCTFGTTYPNSIGDDYNTFQITLAQGTNTMKAKGGSNLYEYLADITINDSDKGYFSVNFWADGDYIYIPEDTNDFETNYSRITQTNNRITQQVANINGQISTINQTANDIQLQVNETSLKIDSGNITLNGNTKVQGDLSISDSTNGFTITNDSNYNTIIKPQSIGDYSDYSSRELNKTEMIFSSENVLITPNTHSSEEHPADAQYFEIRYDNRPNNFQVYLEAGSTLNLNSFNGFNMNFFGYSYKPSTYTEYTFTGNLTPSASDYENRMYIKGKKYDYMIGWHYEELMSFHIHSVVTRISVLDSNDNEVAYTELNGITPILNYSYTVTTSGNYKIKAYSLIRFNSLYNYTGERMDNVLMEHTNIYYNINIKSTLSSNSIQNIIGYDGIALSLGTNNIAYFGKDETHISYGKNQLVINGTGLYKYAGSTVSAYQNESTLGTDTGLSNYVSEYVHLNGCVVRKLTNSGTFYLQPRDEIINYVGNTNDSYLWVGLPQNEVGRKIYIKATGSRTNIIVGTFASDSTRRFIVSSDRDKELNFTVGSRCAMLLSDGEYWWINWTW